MRIGIIGVGAIGSFVHRELQERGFEVRALLVRPGRIEEVSARYPDPVSVAAAGDLPDDLELVIDCAGQQALKIHGPDILRRGIDLATVSIGALADA